jgi:hypothetical protein
MIINEEWGSTSVQLMKIMYQKMWVSANQEDDAIKGITENNGMINFLVWNRKKP